MPETVASLLAAHRDGRMSPEETVARSYERIRTRGDPAIFISLRDEGEVRAEARALGGKHDLPLCGIPVAVKDNIDVAGLPTTAACPAFAYRPLRDATAVARLRAAGAIIIGKTNLDQFATGLVGTRSPCGIPRNACNPALIPGGSSSGSAVAVAAGLVPLALGTDTAGSGRVPAGLNNIVGVKPSVGLVSTAGLVPACRTLDCISVFSLTVDDGFAALEILAGEDRADPYSRARPLGASGPMPRGLRIAVPRPEQRVFFGNDAFSAAYKTALSRLAALGLTITEIDIQPFYETARLLYEGPWVAERYLATRTLLASSPEAMHPVTREIIGTGAKPSAADAFAAFYKLEELRRLRDHAFRMVDLMALPTIPTAYSVEQLLASPIELNSRLGIYTNFVNLLDLCGLAVPAAMLGDVPFGITLLAPGGEDALLASIGREFHTDTQLPLGALGEAQPAPAPTPTATADEITLAVVGAHLSGMPLNGELRDLGGRLLEATTTAPTYQLYALTHTTPPKPGLLRVANSEGVAIEVELWGLSAEGFGRFVASVPPPLSIGTLTLANGREVKGFLVEASAVYGARNISDFGGWRNFVSSLT